MPKNDDEMVRVNISVSKDLLEEFDKLCKNQTRCRSAQIAHMMKRAIQQFETREGLEVGYPLISK